MVTNPGSMNVMEISSLSKEAIASAVMIETFLTRQQCSSWESWVFPSTKWRFMA